MHWLRSNYRRHNFFAERDIVWTLQIRILAQAIGQQWRVFDNYRLPNGKIADLTLLNADHSVDITAELKYEPDHKRTDISAGKLKPSKVYWNSRRDGGVEPDICRVRKFVAQGVARVGYFILIDEGSYFQVRRKEPQGSKWEDWGVNPYSKSRISVLIAKF